MKKLLLYFSFFILHSSFSCAQIITTIAGNGNQGYSGNGLPATSMYCELNNPYAVFADKAGNFYVADGGNNAIRKIDNAGIISTYAGNGVPGYGGDGGTATAAQLNTPYDVFADSFGNMYIADYGNNGIRKINTLGIISTIAGIGRYGYSGDGGQATDAELYAPSGVCTDKAGNVYIADEGNSRIRKIDNTGIISTIAGNGIRAFSGDGGPATAAELFNAFRVCMNPNSDIVIADVGNQRIREINISGIINTIAGNGRYTFSGDGGPATAAEINGPFGICYDSSGNLYISDEYDQRIREVYTSGIINTIAGNGIAGYSGDGGMATAAELNTPAGICADEYGNILIAEQYNYVIRKVIYSTEGINSIINETSISVYPNPTSQTLNININKIYSESLAYTIIDVTGRVIMSWTKRITNNSLQVDVSILSPGLYFVSISINGVKYTQKFVKI